MKTVLQGVNAAPPPNLGATDRYQTLVIHWGGEKDLRLLRTPIAKGFPKEREFRFPQGRCGTTGNFWGYLF